MDLVQAWNAELAKGNELTPEFCREFARSMRARKLTFGDRIHCPFIRPFLLSATEEARVRNASETLARLGERIARDAANQTDSRALGVYRSRKLGWYSRRP